MAHRHGALALRSEYHYLRVTTWGVIKVCVCAGCSLATREPGLCKAELHTDAEGAMEGSSQQLHGGLRTQHPRRTAAPAATWLHGASPRIDSAAAPSKYSRRPTSAPGDYYNAHRLPVMPPSCSRAHTGGTLRLDTASPVFGAAAPPNAAPLPKLSLGAAFGFESFPSSDRVLRVQHIKPGGPVARSEQIQVGDVVQTINEQLASYMSSEGVKHALYYGKEGSSIVLGILPFQMLRQHALGEFGAIQVVVQRVADAAVGTSRLQTPPRANVSGSISRPASRAADFTLTSEAYAHIKEMDEMKHKYSTEELKRKGVNQGQIGRKAVERQSFHAAQAANQSAAAPPKFSVPPPARAPPLSEAVFSQTELSAEAPDHSQNLREMVYAGQQDFTPAQQEKKKTLDVFARLQEENKHLQQTAFAAFLSLEEIEKERAEAKTFKEVISKP